MNPVNGSGFALSDGPIDLQAVRARLADPACGAYVCFEGWVRDHHHGRAVQSLRYEAYAMLAQAAGEQVLDEARGRFGLQRLACVHRTGLLQVGELAVVAAACAAHREEAFAACRFVIDAVKLRVPIWKHETYLDGTAAWVEGCHVHAPE